MQTKKISITKLIASEGKIIVSKTKTDDGFGNLMPDTAGKEIYVAANLKPSNFEEIDETEYNELLEAHNNSIQQSELTTEQE